MPRKADPALADTRRREILDAAARCFVRRGLHATSMREILSEAGLSTGAVYNYFDSKEAIIEAMAARERREIDELAAYLENARDPRKAIVEAVSAIILECSADYARLSVEFLAEASRNPRVHAAITSNDKALRDAFRDAIGRALRAGRIQATLAPPLLLETVVAVYEGFVGRIAFDGTADRRQFAKAASDVLSYLFDSRSK